MAKISDWKGRLSFLMATFSPVRLSMAELRGHRQVRGRGGAKSPDSGSLPPCPRPLRLRIPQAGWRPGIWGPAEYCVARVGWGHRERGSRAGAGRIHADRMQSRPGVPTLRCGKFPSWGLNCHCRDLSHELRGPFEKLQPWRTRFGSDSTHGPDAAV